MQPLLKHISWTFQFPNGLQCHLETEYFQNICSKFHFEIDLFYENRFKLYGCATWKNHSAIITNEYVLRCAKVQMVSCENHTINNICNFINRRTMLVRYMINMWCKQVGVWFSYSTSNSRNSTITTTTIT